MPTNAEIARQFESFAAVLELLGANKFKVLAFQKVARTLDGMAEEAADLLATPGALEAIDGIGASSATKIREYVETGRIAELDELRASIPPGIFELFGISGLGPKTIKLLWEEGGVVDKASLKAKLESGALKGLPRMGDKTLANIADSLALSERSAGRIKLGDAMPLAEAIVAYMAAVPGVERVAYAGSLRRGKETIGDIDILCASSTPPTAHAAFRAQPGVAKVLTSGDTKTSVVTADGVQVDLRTLPLASFGAALMYFTGSKEHNVRLRERAIAMGFRLNEYGLFPDDGESAPQHRGVVPIASATEEEVFGHLGLAWIPPELREDRGEIDLAERRALPNLIALGDLRSDLHAHTRASDGAMTIAQLADAARARGFHTIAVTDHSKSSVQANGLSVERLREHVAAVRAANRASKDITILAGSEVDILADGRLDYDDETLGLLDVVVASPHASLRQPPETATARLITAIEHPRTRILGHPTGRLINARPGLEPDMRAVIAAAKANDVALEINANPYRLDLRDTHVKAAVDAGCLIAINCDAHEASHFDFAVFGVLTGRRGWLPPEQCINCFERDRLLAWLRREA